MTVVSGSDEVRIHLHKASRFSPCDAGEPRAKTSSGDEYEVTAYRVIDGQETPLRVRCDLESLVKTAMDDLGKPAAFGGTSGGHKAAIALQKVKATYEKGSFVGTVAYALAEANIRRIMPTIKSLTITAPVGTSLDGRTIVRPTVALKTEIPKACIKSSCPVSEATRILLQSFIE